VLGIQAFLCGSLNNALSHKRFEAQQKTEALLWQDFGCPKVCDKIWLEPCAAKFATP
jgi:hypothetical protein